MAQCMDFLTLWAVALQSDSLTPTAHSGPERTGQITQVCEFGVRTRWGSDAKFYRLLKLWREVTETDSPAVVLDRVKVSKERTKAMTEVFTLTPAQVGVV